MSHLTWAGALLVGAAITVLVSTAERLAQIAAGKRDELGGHATLAAFALIALLWAVTP